ncbi:MAG: class II fructose-bisphosphatase [bacterium]
MDDKTLTIEFVRVTEHAAIASAKHAGRGDEKAADKAAVDSMRSSLDSIDIDGTIVIGEGERDQAPMLYIGEKVGTGKGQKIDIAVDPLEGTTICAQGGQNSISVMAIADHGHFLHAPDTYMDKIAVGPKAKGVIDLSLSPSENLHRIAEALNRYVEDLTVVILNRERHKNLIKEVRSTGARIKLIQDGDISGAIAAAKEETGVDALMGIGGAPEGVISAAALKCVGGDMQGKLTFRNNEEKERAKKMGIEDFDKIYSIDELASGDVIFAATGVTTGDYLPGVVFFPGGAKTNSVVMRSKTRTARYIEAVHYFDYKDIV